MSEALATEQAPIEQAPPPVETNDGPSEDEQMEAIWQKAYGDADGPPPDGEGTTDADGGPLRDERGRFVSEAGENAAEADQSAESAEDGKEAAPVADEAEDAQTDALAAPKHLTPALREAWADMPEPARQAIVEQQAATDRKFAEQGRALATYRPVAEKLIQAAQASPAFKGMSPDQIAEGAVSLAHVQAAMQKDPFGTLRQIADQYGVGEQMRQHYGGAPSEDGGTVARLEQQVAALNRQLAESNNPDRLSQTVEQMLDQREINRSVQEFAAGADLYAVVEPHLPRFIEAVRQEQPDAPPSATLEAAYEKALREFGLATDEASVTTGEKPAVTPPIDQKRTDAAKRAAAANLRGRDGAKPREKSEDELLEEVAQKYGLS